MMWTPTKPVDINWQTIFALAGFLIPLDAWAFLRIQKFRQYILRIILPSVVIVVITSITNPFDVECESVWSLILVYDTCASFSLNLFHYIVGIGFTAYGIYLVRKWSAQWNKKFELNS